ncbi:hypothetical protein PN478_07865 [Dolichospermum circinale CS-534/05]|uniref:hypothetical protein n=1 Tax=Dolichospermum circinale TaxID=109265 RepID=UPI0003F533DB|nr:hypothetical protein [Dolichospermum circinale]MDB9478954.1 hypothetical protein [Dolichospermum circinale CS-537/03]MDB9490434.1 hypothetical protein [Dolichospermum circinale CS-534/05]
MFLHSSITNESSRDYSKVYFITHYQLPITHYQLPITHYQLPNLLNNDFIRHNSS